MAANDKMQTRPAQTAVAKTAGRDFMRDLLGKMEQQIARVLPKHLTVERMIQIVLVEGSRNPKLRTCTPESLIASVMLCSELGLEPSGPKGHAYLIPRWSSKAQANECSVQIGYKGYIELAYRSGRIGRINAAVVYQPELDEGIFSATIEPPEIHHGWSPTIAREDKALVAAYATVMLKEGQYVQAILSRPEIEARHARSEAAKKGWSSPWDSDFAAMARKTAIRSLLTGGLVPLSSELAKALDADADAIDTTADEGPVEPKKKQPRANPLAGLLTSPEPKVEPDPDQEPEPPTNPMVEEAVSACERYATQHQGVIPDWMPESAIAITRLDDAHLSALLDRIASEEQ